MPFWRSYFHVVWCTKERAPVISAQVEPRLYGVLRSLGERMGVAVCAVNGTDDQVHLVMSVPPTVAPANLIGHLKGASARLINAELSPERPFAWGGGYGLFTISPRQPATAVSYVRS